MSVAMPLVVAAGIVLAVLILHDVLLLAFGGVLVAALLTGFADQLRVRFRMPAIAALALAGVGFAAIAAGAFWFVSAMVVSQIDALREAFVASLAQVRRAPWGMIVPDLQTIVPSLLSVVQRATGLISSTLGGLIGAAVAVFVGICLAIEPAFYRDATIELFPVHLRARLRSVFDEAGDTLRAWLFARLVSMVALGTLVSIGLTLLRIPFATTLGAIAGLLAFIPNIGALAAALPALLFALALGPERAALVAAIVFASPSLGHQGCERMAPAQPRRFGGRASTGQQDKCSIGIFRCPDARARARSASANRRIVRSVACLCRAGPRHRDASDGPPGGGASMVSRAPGRL